MNAAIALVSLVLACNAPRRRVALSTHDSRAVALGAACMLGALVVLAAVATPLLDALDVSAPNLRIGAGLVLAVVAAHDVVWRPPESGAALAGLRAGIVPVLFPVLLRPEVALLAIAIGADHGVAFTLLSGALAMAVVVAWHAVATPRADRPVLRRVERGLGVLDAGVTAALAVAIVADGVFAI
ncbi:MAG TPA: hypothetical protein VF183_16605, partial [Acidimicrobiales bacterium]